MAAAKASVVDRELQDADKSQSELDHQQPEPPIVFDGLWGRIFARGFPQGPTSATDGPKKFLSLPLEIRFMVYQFAMDELPKAFTVRGLYVYDLDSENEEKDSMRSLPQTEPDDLEADEKLRIILPTLSTALLSNTLPAFAFASRRVLYESMLAFLRRTRFSLMSLEDAVLNNFFSFLRQFPFQEGFESIREVGIRSFYFPLFADWSDSFLFLTGLRRLYIGLVFHTLDQLRHFELIRAQTTEEFRVQIRSSKFSRLSETNPLKELIFHVIPLEEMPLELAKALVSKEELGTPLDLAIALEVLKEELGSQREGWKIKTLESVVQ